MSFDLPPHLQTLNTIPTNSPPSGINDEQEEAFWGYMHTDDLFTNFGFVPSPNDGLKDEAPQQQQQGAEEQLRAGQEAVAQLQLHQPSTTTQTQTPASTLESFLAAFAGELSTPLPVPANTPSGQGVSTADILGGEEDEDRPSGAKKLKSMGAGHVEIEEDKRRRNTEASARFRAKKKEREQAVEKRAKELENQVAKLISEKTSLENENRLLKAIVLNGTGGQADTLQGALTAFGKRKREA